MKEFANKKINKVINKKELLNKWIESSSEETDEEFY